MLLAMILFVKMACRVVCLLLNMRAGLVMIGFFRFVILAIVFLGDKLLLRMVKWLCLYMAFSMEWIIVLSGGVLGMFFKILVMVWLVMVM